MADATVKLTPGTGTCQHVRVEITHEGETRTFTCLKDEIINGEQKNFGRSLATSKRTSSCPVKQISRKPPLL